MNDYEIAFIVKPNIDEEGIATIVGKISQSISRMEGEVVNTNIWGRRRLAYPIKNYVEGTYILFEANMPPSAVSEVERDIKLSEDIIRHLLFKIEH